MVSRFSNETHALTAEDVPHVFDRFFTSDKMRTGRNTGLGLAIVKALAGQMDCRAEAALEGICLPSPSAGRLSGGNKAERCRINYAAAFILS